MATYKRTSELAEITAGNVGDNMLVTIADPDGKTNYKMTIPELTKLIREQVGTEPRKIAANEDGSFVTTDAVQEMKAKNLTTGTQLNNEAISAAITGTQLNHLANLDVNVKTTLDSLASRVSAVEAIDVAAAVTAATVYVYNKKIAGVTAVELTAIDILNEMGLDGYKIPFGSHMFEVMIEDPLNHYKIIPSKEQNITVTCNASNNLNEIKITNLLDNKKYILTIIFKVSTE